MNKLPSYENVRTKLSLREKIGQLFMPAAFVNDSEEEIQQLEWLINEKGVGGLCFFHSRASAATNFEGKKKVVYNEQSFQILKRLIKRYQRAAKVPLLIAIDAEWGLAMRIENTPQYPYAITLGAIQEEEEKLIFKIGQHIANDCKAAGIHWNLAPVVDINNNPKNPVIGYRSFGEGRSLVTKKALSFVKGTQSEGILTSIKHFPGHGDTATDSHLGLPLINKSKKALLENELYPFQILMEEGVDSVMVGHLSVPALANDRQTPSSISKNMIKGLLRTEMGYQGVVISDALNMHAVSKEYPIKGELEWLAFDAGNDVLCFSEHIKEGIDTIVQNATDAQVEESFLRIWRLKEKAFLNLHPNTVELTEASRLNSLIAKKSLSLFQGSAQDISNFRHSSFAGISNIQNTENQFFNTIQKNKNFQSILITGVHGEELKKRLTGHQDLLLALFPPQVKPTHYFGFSENEFTIINELIATKNVVLYLFGNPYVLNHITFKKAKAVVIAYQDFPEFQEHAVNHFLGRTTAEGKLPISIQK